MVVVKDDAFLGAREHHLRDSPNPAACSSRILIQSGRVLSVFGKKPVVIKAGNATIGIRGTGAYLEVDPEKRLLLPVLRRGGSRRARHGRPEAHQDHAPRKPARSSPTAAARWPRSPVR
ncbi:MAG: hypothetical protein MZW92_12135 [Comamonadaceae bacterium]|nr:hypothetical protein [Comamonadaceae bacterium]